MLNKFSSFSLNFLVPNIKLSCVPWGTTEAYVQQWTERGDDDGEDDDNEQIYILFLTVQYFDVIISLKYYNMFTFIFILQ